MSTSPAVVVADRYRLVAPLGQGGMGRVWRAMDVVLHREVAIKELVPPPGLTPEERQEMRERSLREARAIARLNHINVVRIFDVLRTDGDPWIVMEYVPSRSLQDTIASDGPFTAVRAAEIGLGVLNALRAAHRNGVVHRDIKPGNVLVGAEGRVVLTDFGLATVPGDPNVTRTGLVLGSPAYIAPERARDGTSGPAADLWSLGATLYAAVEGASPFARPSAIATLAALATENPPPARNAGPLKPVLNGLLRKDPTHRINAEEAERLLLRAAGRRSKMAFAMNPSMRRPGVGRERPALPSSPPVVPGFRGNAAAGSAPVVPGPRPPIIPGRPQSGSGENRPQGRPTDDQTPVYTPGKATVGNPRPPNHTDRADATRVDAPPVRDNPNPHRSGTGNQSTQQPGRSATGASPAGPIHGALARGTRGVFGAIAPGAAQRNRPKDPIDAEKSAERAADQANAERKAGRAAASGGAAVDAGVTDLAGAGREARAGASGQRSPADPVVGPREAAGGAAAQREAAGGAAPQREVAGWAVPQREAAPAAGDHEAVGRAAGRSDAAERVVREQAANQRAAEVRATAEAAAARKAAAEREALERAAALWMAREKAATGKVPAEKAAADRVAAERAAETSAAAEREAAQRAAAEKAAVDRAAADKAAADKAATERDAVGRATAESVVAEKAAAERGTAGLAAAEGVVAEKAAERTAPADPATARRGAPAFAGADSAAAAVPDRAAMEKPSEGAAADTTVAERRAAERTAAETGASEKVAAGQQTSTKGAAAEQQASAKAAAVKRAAEDVVGEKRAAEKTAAETATDETAMARVAAGEPAAIAGLGQSTEAESEARSAEVESEEAQRADAESEQGERPGAGREDVETELREPADVESASADIAVAGRQDAEHGAARGDSASGTAEDIPQVTAGAELAGGRLGYEPDTDEPVAAAPDQPEAQRRGGGIPGEGTSPPDNVAIESDGLDETAAGEDEAGKRGTGALRTDVPAFRGPNRPAWQPMELKPRASAMGLTIFGTTLTRRQTATAGAIVLALILIVLAIVVPKAFGDGDQTAKQTGAGPTTSAQSSPSQTTKAAAPPATAAPSRRASGTGVKLPAGWYLYKDQTGFSVPVPRGWSVRRQGTEVYFQENGGQYRLLIVDQTNHPKPDPRADWQNQEAQRISSYRDYHRIRIATVSYWDKAADWEFTRTSDSGNPLHVVKRGFITAPDLAYGITWSTSAGDWNANKANLELIYRGFVPARS